MNLSSAIAMMFSSVNVRMEQSDLMMKEVEVTDAGPTILFRNLDNVTEHVPKCTCSHIHSGVSDWPCGELCRATQLIEPGVMS